MTVYDRGLQPERTVLAWRRTLLAIAVAAAAGARLGVVVLGGVALMVGAAVLLGVLFASISAQHRYRAVTETLLRDGVLLGAGGQVVVVAGCVILLGVGALVAIMLRLVT